MNSAKGRAKALTLVALLAGCQASPERLGFERSQGPYTVEVSYPRWVRGPYLPVDITLTNSGGAPVTHPMPKSDKGCGLSTVPLTNVRTAEHIQPLPEPKPSGCHTDGLVLHLEAGQTAQQRFWYSVRGVPAGVYTLPLNLPPEFGSHRIEVQVRE